MTAVRWATVAVASSMLFMRAAGAITATPLDVTLTPQDLAQTLVGPGISVSNVVYTGATSAAGAFVDGADSVGIDTGVILSSGRVEDIIGPNALDNVTTIFGTPGDADLEAINPGFATFDASVLEFDFVPSGPEITFTYVFGSDEYNEFVGDDFNDVFAFFVNGVNRALLPDGVTPVSINTVNDGNVDLVAPPVNPAFYVNNDCDDTPCALDFEADGRTVVLTFKAPVNPGVQNHLKLAIADVSDQTYDSWVFVKTGSLTLSEQCDNLVDDDGDGLVDGEDPDCWVCGDGDVDPNEQCDDGNVASGDGCSATCTFEAPTTTTSTTTTTTSAIPSTSGHSTTTTTVTTSSISTDPPPPTTTSSTSTHTTSSSSSSTSSTSTVKPTTSSTSTSTTLANRAPRCAEAQAQPAILSPANHVLTDVSIAVPDPDGDTVALTVTGIRQDEPVDGDGDGTTCPDADGVGTDTARLRAERADGGDGRVYHVAFTADDGRGGTCTGEALVCVPHDAGGTCGDDGALVDAVAGGGCPSAEAPPLDPIGDSASVPVAVEVPADAPGTGKVTVTGQLFADPGAAGLMSGTAAGLSFKPIKISAPVVRNIKPGGHATITLKLNRAGKKLLRRSTGLTVRANIVIKRKGVEKTVFDIIKRWLKR